MATVAAKMKNEGIEVVNFSVGEPDFNTPDHIINAGKNAMDQGYTKYTAGPGMIEFRNAISNKLLTENGVKVALDEILVSNGESRGDPCLSPQTWLWSLAYYTKSVGATLVLFTKQNRKKTPIPAPFALVQHLLTARASHESGTSVVLRP